MPKSETFDRNQVMDNITTLFWKKGFNGTSMQDIVDASGLNRSSIYNSFGDKFGLYLSSLKHYRSSLQAPIMDSLKGLNPKEALRVFYEDVPRSIEENTSDRGCLITNCTTELINQNDSIDEYVAKSVDETIEFFRELLRIGKEQGEFDENLDIEKTALYLYSSLLGLRVTAMQIRSKEKISALIDEIIEKI